MVTTTRATHGAAKLISVWLVTNPTLPGFRMFNICNPDERPDVLGDHDEAEVVLQYLEHADEDGEDLDDFVLTALQVQSWQIAHAIHAARLAKRAMKKAGIQ